MLQPPNLFRVEDDMKTTLREIARQAQVHQSTASHVLNGTGGSTRVSEETRERVLQVARQLGYSANRAAQQLRTRRSNVVGLLVGELENPFFARLVSLCTAELERAGYESVLAMRRQGEVSDLHLLQTLLSRQVDGLLLWSESITEIRDWLEKTVNVPDVVVLGYKIEGCDSVEASLHVGVEEALMHLVEQGFQRIGYLVPSGSVQSVGDPRTDVYRRVMEQAGRPVRIYAYEGVAHTPEAARCYAERIACERPEERPDALFCFNDMTAMGAMMGLRRKGLRIPQDIALVGCDGLPMVEQMDVPITSISFPLEEMCRAAVPMLLERVESRAESSGDKMTLPPRYHVFPTKLSVRESSRCYSSSHIDF
jgi:LacI family transcriptional regulator